MHFDASSADCQVFTFKEGLLSAVAHDLKIRVSRFSFDVNPETGQLDARFDAGSLKVVCAMKNGVEDHSLLSDSDKTKIEGNIASDVLDARRHPEIRFVVDSGARVGDARGTLTVKGISRPVAFSVREEGGKRISEVTLHQPDFGIKPFSAMLGALKIKPDVRIRMVIPWQG